MSSSSTSRSASWSSWFPRRSLPEGKRAGKHPRRRSSAVTGSSTSTTCCRRTRAPTSISSSARAAPSSRATTTEEGPMLQAAELTIRLHPQDDVVIARMEIPTGTRVAKEKVSAIVTIPAGHKLAVRDIAEGQPVRRYNQIIGFATRAIRSGEHVHVHNIAMGEFERDYAFCSQARETQYIAPQ